MPTVDPSRRFSFSVIFYASLPLLPCVDVRLAIRRLRSSFVGGGNDDLGVYMINVYCVRVCVHACVRMLD